MAAKKGSRKTSAAVGVAEAGVATLAEIVSATLDNAKGFLYTSPAVHIPLIEAGLVEINAAMTNEAGEVATRATEKGMQQMSNTSHAETTAPVAGSASGFVIKTVELPPISGRGRASGASKYPFDALQVGQSFFVPVSDGMKEPTKTLASTVVRANLHYSEVVEGQTKKNRKGEDVPMRKQIRQFVLRSIADGAAWDMPGVSGAAVQRTL